MAYTREETLKDGTKIGYFPDNNWEVISYPPKSELGITSTDSALQDVNKMDSTLTRLSGQLPLEEQQRRDRLQAAGIDPNAPAYKETQPVKPQDEPDSKGQFTLEEVLQLPGIGNDLTGVILQKDGKYSLDSSALSRLGMKTSSQQGEASNELAQAKTDYDEAVSRLKNFDVSNDPALKSIVQSIENQYSQRMKIQEDIEKRRVASLETTGIRIGSRYTGNQFGGLISAEERAGQDRLMAIESEKQSAVARAQEAYRTGKWTEYAKFVDIAEKKWTESQRQVEKLNELAIEQNEKAVNQFDDIKKAQDIELKTIDSIGYLALSALGETGGEEAISELAGQYGIDPNKLISKAQELQGKEKAWGTPYDMPGIGRVQMNLQTGEIRTLSPTSAIPREESYKPPTSYQEWELAGKPGTYQEWLKSSSAKPPTAAQETVSTYATRIEQADPIISKLEPNISSMNPVKFEAQIRVPSYLQSSEFQQYMQAARNFINATLRRESGAVIADSEFENAYQQYLPRPGDAKETLKQKSDNRKIVYESFKKAAGSAYQSVSEILGGNKIKVKLNDGRIGTIDEFEFNPNTMTKL